MAAQVIERQGDRVTIQVQITLGRSMLDNEGAIAQALNEAGVLATTESLARFDTDGSPLEIGATRYTSKGREPKTYQTPYGEAVVERHVYQTSAGGATFCPLERDARIILTSTPRFAMQVSHKYAEMPGARVAGDLAGSHARDVSLCLIQDLALAVGTVALAQEEQWQYALPPLDKPVATVSAGLDGTCLFLCDDGPRQAMVGTISLYDAQGERLHTIYAAATPEYGKETFYERLGREISRTCALFPQAYCTGVADGSADNWAFLRQFADDECIDFYHATGYLGKAAPAACPRGRGQRERWMGECCHRLKHEAGAARAILGELKAIPRGGLPAAVAEDLQAALTYFGNHHPQMNYAERRAAGLPIGSGVTEAACKSLVKVRMCRGGAKWKEEGAAVVLSLRALSYTPGRWEQFWAKLDRHGFPLEMAA